jgi:hypothetical protein
LQFNFGKKIFEKISMSKINKCQKCYHSAFLKKCQKLDSGIKNIMCVRVFKISKYNFFFKMNYKNFHGHTHTHTQTKQIYRNLCVQYYYHYFNINFASNYIYIYIYIFLYMCVCVCVCVCLKNKRKCVCLKFLNMISSFENNQWLYTHTRIKFIQIYLCVCVFYYNYFIKKFTLYNVCVCLCVCVLVFSSVL